MRQRSTIYALLWLAAASPTAAMRRRSDCLVAAASMASAKPAGSSSGGVSRQRLKQRDTSFVRSAAAGGAAAAAATVAFHPLDTVKVVLQGGAGFAALRGLGASGLYRGVLPAAFSMMPACAVRMGAYEVLKGALLTHAPKDVPPSVSVFLASACSVVVSCTVRAPLDMIKTKVQADATISAAGALRAAWGAGGMVGLSNMYRGAGLALIRDVPFFGFNLLIYEQLKAAALVRANERARASAASACERSSRAGKPCKGKGGGGCTGACCHNDAPAAIGTGCKPALPVAQLSAVELLLIGFTAQGIAGLLTNPADVLKTRVQSGSAAGVFSAFDAAMRDGGPLALMRGAGMRVVWIAPQGCIYYPTYEAVQTLLQRLGF